MEAGVSEYAMKVFLSWSGDRGRRIAEALRSWLPDVLQTVIPWVSSEDIDPGLRWSSEIATQLQNTRFGIICVTPESLKAPWLMFESGALAKTVASTYVCPYLFGLAPTTLREPLAQFDAVKADEQGTLKLVRSLNRALGQERQLSDDRIRRYFDKWWPDLHRDLSEIEDSAPQGEVSVVGVEGSGLRQVCVNRTDALASFASALRREIERQKAHRDASDNHPFVYITGTSLRGFLVTAAGEFDGRRILSEILSSGCVLRIMLTEPEVAERRRQQEGRPPGLISGEVRKSIEELFELGVQKKQLKCYTGGPTVFGIATSEMMLLNPYPNEMESQHGFSVIVARTTDLSCIYHRYLKYHFDRPWNSAKSIESVQPGLANIVPGTFPETPAATVPTVKPFKPRKNGKQLN
jgi:hypothetical protein